MYTYSVASMQKLEECDERLQEVFRRVAEYWNTTILEGHRTVERQQALFNSDPQRSKLDGINKLSNHNYMPSKAVDAAPWPWRPRDIERFKAFSGSVVFIGQHLGYNIRWGGDWDRDYDQHDQNFNDLVHFEVLD